MLGEIAAFLHRNVRTVTLALPFVVVWAIVIVEAARLAHH